MGVLSALPIINIGNACCCLWVVSGGLVAAYLLQQNMAAPMTASDGAIVGLLAGIIGAVVWFLISIPLGILIAPMERSILQRSLEMAGDMPPEVRQMLENMSQRRGGVIGLLVVRIIGFFFTLVIGSMFSTVGGLLGAAIFKKKLPPGTIDVAPPSESA